MLSGHGSVKTAVESTKLGAFDFIEKPPDGERILVVARNALSQRRLSEENRRLKLTFDRKYRMVGKSAALEKVWESVEKHLQLEKQMVGYVEETLGEVKNRKMMVQEYLLNYLKADEEKHDALLSLLEGVKKGMYPYG